MRRVDDAARLVWGSLNTAATGSEEIWSDLDTHDFSDLAVAFHRVESMALAVGTPQSTLHDNIQFVGDTIAAVDWLHTNRYNPTTPKKAAFWWFYEIGIPLAFNDITALLYPHLSQTQVASFMDTVTYFAPAPKNTAANRVWSAYVVGLRAVLSKQPSTLKTAVEAMRPALSLVTAGDGFYADGSYVQHLHHAYTGGYGISLIQTVSRFYYLLQGSQWQPTDAAGLSIYDRVQDTYAPVTSCGGVMSVVRGREVARSVSQDDAVGVTLQSAVLRLAEIAPATYAAKTKRAVKHWLDCGSNNSTSIESAGGVADVVRSRLLLRDSSVSSAAVAAGAYAFNGMDRFVFNGTDYAFAVGMSSSRIAGYEALADENLHGWYTGSGATYLHLGEGSPYSHDFWATANPYRIPGTTEDTVKRGETNGRTYLSGQSFAGGLASPAGSRGIAAMSYDADGNNLAAKKAWFVFEDRILAVGAGITSTNMSGNGWDGKATRIETTIDDRIVTAGGAELRLGDTTVPLGSAVSALTRWASIEGPGEHVGYVFPVATTVKAQREQRTSSWNAINRLESTAPASNVHLTLTVNHGANPTNSSYSYILLPSRSAQQTSDYARNPDVDILASGSGFVAAYDRRSRTSGLVSFDGAHHLVQPTGSPWVSIDGAAIAMVEEDQTSYTVTVSDPTQLSTTPIVVTLGAETSEYHASSSAVSWSSGGGQTAMRFSPGGLRGRPLTISVVKKPAPPAEFTIVGQLVVTGDTVYGGTLSAKVPGVTPKPDSTHYQWYRGGTGVSGAVGQSYPLKAADVGQVMSVRVTLAKVGVKTMVLSSAPTGVVRPLRFATTPVPRITGTRASRRRRSSCSD
ncbi:hypothetical protein GCM10009776_27090 [Microbacterium deminutum]|uniref:Hyaluronate lyase n=1 Tax=Microbacterium deminutum TaxID=344164 RepID=A0ABP5CHL6_9MICO